MRRSRAAACALALLLLALPSAASANRHVDRGLRRYESADFRGALRSLRQAERGPLTREELVVLVETRALVLFALGRSEEAARDVAALASLEPDRSLESAPPEMADAFRAARARAPRRLAVHAELDVQEGIARVRAHVTDDPAELVSHILVHARIAGDDAWERGEGEVSLPVSDGARVEYYVIAEGPGGSPVAAAGSEERPLVHDRSRTSLRLTPPLPAAEPAPGRQWWEEPGPWVAGGGAVLAAVLLVVAIVAGTSGPGGTQSQGPTIVMP